MTRVLQQIARRIRLLASRAALSGSDDAGAVQRVQVRMLGEEVADNVEHLQPFGLSSRAPDGADAVVLSIGGARSHPVVIVVADRRFRKTNLQKGESALHNQWGDYVYLREDGTLEVVSRAAVAVTAPKVTVTASTKVTLATPLVECTQDLTAAGNISDANGSMQEMRDVYNTHKMTGVTPGGGLSGPTDTPMS